MATSDFIATTSADAIRAYWWIEIEGIRSRIGSRDPAWNPVVGSSNQHIYPYIEKIPAFSPQVAEPLDGTTTPHGFTVDIVDVDEVFTGLMSTYITAANSTLDEDLTKNETGVDVADSTLFSVDDDFFVGRETMKITNIAGNTLTVSRGMYGSRRATHSIGDPCYNKQPFMLTREVILYENRRAAQPYMEASEGLPKTDAIKIRGYMESAEEHEGVWTLHCSGFLRRMNTRIGENLARSTLKGNLWNGTVQSGSDEWNTYQDAPVSNIIPLGSTSDFQASGHVIIDRELIEYVEIATPPPGIAWDSLCLSEDAADFSNHFHPLDTAGRGLLASEIFGEQGYVTVVRLSGGTYIKSVLHEGHAIGAEVKEVIHSDKFTAGTGPAAVILTLLTSTGDADNGTYDVLPKGWGCGIDVSYIDVAGIENICKEPPLDSLDFAPFVIPDPVDCGEWLEENILRPCLLFFVEDEMGIITIKRLYNRNEAIELTTPTVLTGDELIGLPSMKMGYPFGEFRIKMNYVPGADDFLGTVICKLDKGNKYYLGGARRFEIECKTLYDSRIGRGRGSWSSDETGDLPSFLPHYLGVIWNNYALKPLPILKFSVAFNMLYYVQVGQVITVTCSGLIDLRNGDRGVVTEYFQIVETGHNPEQSTVDCVAWMIGANNADTRRLAPAAKVTAWNAGTNRATCEDSEFADGDQYTYDTQGFSAGQEVMLVDGTYKALDGAGVPEKITILEVTASAGNCTIQFDAVPTDAPGAGDYIIPARYDDCISTQQDNWAYLADSSAGLGATPDDAHRRGR